MLMSVIRNGFSQQALVEILASVFVVFCLLPVHEFAHALVATKLGDETSRLNGRLTLAPTAHIDWLGALTLVLFGFGWGKPVPVNMRNMKMKNKKVGMALVALAGPISNIIMAMLFLVFFWATAYYGESISFQESLLKFFGSAASINVTLAIFNFIPVPPLDGSRILSVALPNKIYYQLMRYERYIALGIMVLAFSGLLTTPLSYLSGKLFTLLSKVTAYPFRLFL